MSNLNTLRKMAGIAQSKIDWENSVLLLIDYQNEYIDGKLNLGETGRCALKKAEQLLKITRNKSIPVFHVLHKASASSAVFNCESKLSDVVSILQPKNDEQVIHKSLPNSFFNTKLAELLDSTERKQLIIAGFMSHMCVTATTIRAVELGYDVIVCEDACATRALPDKNQLSLGADLVHEVSMAALSDRYATILSLSDLV